MKHLTQENLDRIEARKDLNCWLRVWECKLELAKLNKALREEQIRGRFITITQVQRQSL